MMRNPHGVKSAEREDPPVLSEIRKQSVQVSLVLPESTLSRLTQPMELEVMYEETSEPICE